MKYLLPFLLLIPLAFPLSAQMDEPASLIKRYAETIRPDHLEAHLSFLAHDLLEGRETGQRGQYIAGHYLAAQFRKMGLQPGNPAQDSYFQNFLMIKSNIKDASLRIGKQKYEYRKDFFTYDAHLLPDQLSDQLVFTGYAIHSPEYDNLLNLDLKGKTALAFAGKPEGNQQSMMASLMAWSARSEYIAGQGADALLLIIPDSIYNTAKLYARRRSLEISKPDEANGDIPVIFLREEVGHELLNVCKLGKASKIREKINKKADVSGFKIKAPDFAMQTELEREEMEAYNVLGYLEGTDKKDELIIITAHYDHLGVNDEGEIYNGADDDGSGTSALMEIAEAFAIAAEEGNRPRRSILFMPVSGEEKGLLGSEYYTDNPLYPIENTVTNLNIDMIGRTDPAHEGKADSTNYVYVIGADKLSTELHEINEEVNDTYTHLSFDYTYNDDDDPNRYYYRSDHYNFARHGIPVIFYFTGTHKDYHKPTDDVEKIQFDKVTKISQLIFSLAWELANRNERVKVDAGN